MAEIKKFKSKKDKFDSWFKEVVDHNPNTKKVVMILHDGKEYNMAYFNVTTKDLTNFKDTLELEIIDKFIIENMSRYINVV